MVVNVPDGVDVVVEPVVGVPDTVVVVVVDDVEEELGAVVEVELVVGVPGTVVDVVVVVVDDIDDSSGVVVVVVGSGQKSAAQLIVVEVVANRFVVEVAATVVDGPVTAITASPTHTITCEIALSPNVPPPCPPGSDTPFLFTSANTPLPASGE